MTDTNSATPAHPTDTPRARPEDIAPEPSRARNRNRSLLIGGGAALAALVLVGGGIAAGAAIADELDDDDDRDASTSLDRDERSGSGSATVDLGTTSADDLTQIIASAATLAEGDAVAVEAERDGAWDVTFVTTAGDETEVRVPVSGEPTVRSTEAADAGDARPVGALDPATIDALVAAVLSDADGRIVQLEIDDDGRGVYDAVVQHGDGRATDIELDGDFTVISSHVDD